MNNLDDPQIYTQPASLTAAITSIASFPKQLEQAWNESSKIQFPNEYKQVKNVVVCGMGGSRFTPLAMRELFKDELRVPFAINDNYSLPGYVDENTLVILSSYSGSTEEVLACAQTAIERKALLSGVTEGGTLAELLTQQHAPFYQFKPIHNPSGQPRIGVGYMLAGHIGIAVAAGLINVLPDIIADGITNLDELLKSFAVNIPTSENKAKELAAHIYGKYPYVVTAEFLQGMGNAFANALNETAKSISSPRVIPELNHHMMEGLKFPAELKNLGLFILFSSTLYNQRVQKRFQITREVVEQNGLKTHVLELKGKTKVEQLFEAIGFGSFVTMYLSVLYQQDPNSIPWVDYFKKRLKE